MQSKLEDGKYSCSEEFVRDARLMWRNCLAFNPPDSPIVALAKEAQALFEREWLAWKRPCHPEDLAFSERISAIQKKVGHGRRGREESASD